MGLGSTGSTSGVVLASVFMTPSCPLVETMLTCGLWAELLRAGGSAGTGPPHSSHDAVVLPRAGVGGPPTRSKRDTPSGLLRAGVGCTQAHPAPGTTPPARHLCLPYCCRWRTATSYVHVVPPPSKVFAMAPADHSRFRCSGSTSTQKGCGIRHRK